MTVTVCVLATDTNLASVSKALIFQHRRKHSSPEVTSLRDLSCRMLQIRLSLCQGTIPSLRYDNKVNTHTRRTTPYNREVYTSPSKFPLGPRQTLPRPPVSPWMYLKSTMTLSMSLSNSSSVHSLLPERS